MPEKIYTINLTSPDQQIRSRHLKLGGTGPNGRTLEVTSAYLVLNGKPFFGISGEFQFSRFPDTYWVEELLKIKASGVNIIAMYFFWIHHEQEKGRFNWSGQNDARRFVQLCEKLGLWVIVRVGPFCHGECRNGGMPDWLYGQPYEVRSNDPGYLLVVSRYFHQIAGQLQGLFFNDGGPIIGLQLENEFGHTGAPWDTADRSQPPEWLPRGDGSVDHLVLLRTLAADAGLNAPLLTFTAWGSPIIELESLPVHGGYAYPVWIDQPGPSNLYCFSNLPKISPGDPSIQYRTDGLYPSIMAEMQGGIQVRYDNRPEIPPKSTEAYALVNAGSGCNFIGYYIYHGGSNPIGSRGFTNEINHPQVSYDFQAPIGEFGEVRDSCRYVKLLHYFFQAFGEGLAPMQVTLPPDADKIEPEDNTSLRWSVRSRGKSGYLFLNNFQDHLQMQDHTDFALKLVLPSQTIQIPAVGHLTLPADACGIFPFNLDMEGETLTYATAQPLTVIRSSSETHFIFLEVVGISPHYRFERLTPDRLSGDFSTTQQDQLTLVEVKPGSERSFRFETSTERTVRITTLTRWEAEHAWLGQACGAPRLIISTADPIFDHDGIELRCLDQAEIDVLVFPPVSTDIAVNQGLSNQHKIDHYTKFTARTNRKLTHLGIVQRENGKFHLSLNQDAFEDVNDLFLKVVYAADTGAAFIDGQLVADNYNNGTPWVIGLKRFIPKVLANGITLKFRPLRKGVLKNTSSVMAARLVFEGDELLQVDSIEIHPEYVFRLQ